MNITNKGRIINFVTGITGIAPGGQAVVNLPVNQRYHRLILQCAAVNYKGGTALATVALTGAGVGLTVTPTILNGVPQSIAVVAGGTGYTTGDTVTMVDATGTGFVGTVTAAAGVVSAVAVTVAGTASPANPSNVLGDCKILVNGVNMRDITPDQILRIACASGYVPRRGELPLFFTPPWRNVNPQNEVTSWDLFGQSTFQIQLAVKSTASLPSVVGIQEFDYIRNTRPDGKGGYLPVLQPTAQHSFTWPIVVGRNDINTLPFGYPISRMWLLGSTPGQISQVEVLQDNNKILEATIGQVEQAYGEYGFTFGAPTYINQSIAGSAVLADAYLTPVYFDAAFVADPDQRWWKALKVANSMVLRVYSDIAQSLTIVQETMPGSFAS